jgi:hypothetical protein
MNAGREVLFEFIQIGKSVKVTAVDTASMVEVSIVGPATAGQAVLRANALRKLEYAIRRRNGGA